ncbi:MAG: excalibur calcium-binding domain-containing protein [Nocardioides sp.]
MTKFRHLSLAAVVTLAGTALVLGGAGAAQAQAKEFKNCTAMHKVYKHGVGKPKAHDKTSGTPVTNFKHSLALYKANKKSDRDGDGIACEA